MQETNSKWVISEEEKKKYIDALADELPSLRAKVGVPQDDLSGIIGISRQTYSSIETKKRRMSWNTFLSLILMFENNEKTKGLLDAIGAFPTELRNVLNIDRRSPE